MVEAAGMSHTPTEDSRSRLQEGWDKQDHVPEISVTNRSDSILLDDGRIVGYPPTFIAVDRSWVSAFGLNNLPQSIARVNGYPTVLGLRVHGLCPFDPLSPRQFGKVFPNYQCCEEEEDAIEGEHGSES